MAFTNSIIFGITEYRDSKKLILQDFIYTGIAVNRSLADTVWRNDKEEMSKIVKELLTNYNISVRSMILHFQIKHTSKT